MKKTLILAIGAMIGMASCKSSLPYTQTSTQPYVQLKTGKRYDGATAKRKNWIVKDKIVLADTSFKSKDVAFYATGTNTYANVGRKSFATQVAAGKINLYKYDYSVSSYDPNAMAGTQFKSSKRVAFYIQNKEGQDVQRLTYRNLVPMVETGTPEFKMLEKYRKSRTVSRSMGYGGLGCIVGGAAMAFSSENATVQGVGASMFGAGLLSVMSSMVTSMINNTRLIKTVIIADKGPRKGHELVID